MILTVVSKTIVLASKISILRKQFKLRNKLGKVIDRYRYDIEAVELEY